MIVARNVRKHARLGFSNLFHDQSKRNQNKNKKKPANQLNKEQTPLKICHSLTQQSLAGASPDPGRLVPRNGWGGARAPPDRDSAQGPTEEGATTRHGPRERSPSQSRRRLRWGWKVTGVSQVDGEGQRLRVKGVQHRELSENYGIRASRNEPLQSPSGRMGRSINPRAAVQPSWASSAVLRS